jgi:hypothetical protein
MLIRTCSDFLLESARDLEMHYYAFDWDDNVLHMPTKILMDRKEGGAWVPVDVSTSDFATLRHDRENYRLRDGDPTKAFSEFRDTGSRGADAFYEDSLKAIRAGRFGPSWTAFRNCLREAALFAIITARGHEPETMRRVVCWIIDNLLDQDEQTEMYARLLKFVHFYTPHDSDEYERVPRGPLSKSRLVTEYLSNCDFYGVSSEYFARQFGAATALNPEAAKQSALDRFVVKCNELGKKLGVKSVSVGFSDDDPKNVEHIQKFFEEGHSKMSQALEHELKLNVYDTRDPSIPGGARTRVSGGVRGIIDADAHLDEATSSWGIGADTMGTKSSVIPFTKWGNMTKELYPTGPDNPRDDNHNRLKNRVGQLTDLLAPIKKTTKKNGKAERLQELRKRRLQRKADRGREVD